MRFIIKYECFRENILEVSKAVSLKTPFPILSGILLTVNKNGLLLTGSNSDIIVQKFVSLTSNGEKIIEVLEAGSVVVSAKYIGEIVKKLSSDIHFAVNDKKIVTLESDEVRTTLIGLSAEEYPSLPQTKESKEVKIPTPVLLQLIKQTSFAVSKSETKPVLTGVNITFQDSSLTFTATNSHRLAFNKLSVKTQVSSSVIVPANSLNELVKLMNKESMKEIHLYITRNYIVFKTETLTLYSRLLEGNYPNVLGLFPQNSKTIVTLNKNNFLKAIDRACLFASELSNNNVRLDILGGTKIKISSTSSEIGKIEETQNIENLEGDVDLSISLDGNFLLDALKPIGEEEIKLSFGGSMRPVLIQPLNNPSYFQLISPVRT